MTLRPRAMATAVAVAATVALGVAAAPAGAIIRGAETPVGAFPWIVQVGSASEVFCTGSLVTPSVVLTAAHCVAESPPTAVVLGRQRTTGPDGLRVRVVRSTFDRRFVAAQRHDERALVSDVGLLQLARPVRTVAPVALPGREHVPLLFAGRRAVVAGWGLTRGVDGDGFVPDPPADGTSLHSVALPLRSSPWCVREIDGGDGSSHGVACAGRLKRPASGGCYGDSGGPLFVVPTTGPVQLGVTSSITKPGCDGGETLFIKLFPGTAARAFVDAHLAADGTLRRAPRPVGRARAARLPGPVVPLRRPPR